MNADIQLNRELVERVEERGGRERLWAEKEENRIRGKTKVECGR